MTHGIAGKGLFYITGKEEMSREDLRTCIVKTGELKECVYTIDGRRTEVVLKEAEVHKGFFHMWVCEQYVINADIGSDQISHAYGIVEYEDGSVHKVDPEEITFTDCENIREK